MQVNIKPALSRKARLRGEAEAKIRGQSMEKAFFMGNSVIVWSGFRCSVFAPVQVTMNSRSTQTGAHLPRIFYKSCGFSWQSLACDLESVFHAYAGVLAVCGKERKGGGRLFEILKKFILNFPWLEYSVHGKGACLAEESLLAIACK